MREKRIYVILRALDGWETEEAVKSSCLDLISILISDDPEPGMENLHQVVVPPELSAQLDRDREEASGTSGSQSSASGAVVQELSSRAS